MTSSLSDDAFKIPLSDELVKCFEHEFLKANYQILKEVETALESIVSHLIKALQEGQYKDELKQLTATEFMLKLYEHLRESKEVLHEIGVHSASESQLTCLNCLPLTATYSCCLLFFHWVDEGFYDFCSINIEFKKRLSHEDYDTLEKLYLQATDKVALLENLLLVDSILRESDITSKHEAFEVSMESFQSFCQSQLQLTSMSRDH